MTQVSLDSSGNPGNASSSQPSISADGRYVAFFSWASNLVDGDINGTSDVFRVSLSGATTEVAISGGNMTVTDIDGGDTDDSLTLSRVHVSGTDYLQVYDPVNELGAGSGASQVDTYTIRVPLSSITGNIQVNTLGGNDTLTVDFSSGNPIPAGGITFAGGENTGDSDTLKLVGYSLTTADGVADVTVNHTGPESGSVVLAGLGTINFSEIEPLTLGGDAADLVINRPAGPNTATVLSDDGGAGDPDGNTADYLAIDDATFEYTQFKNPTNTLTINRGSASDHLTVQDLVVSGFTAGLTIGSATRPFNEITFAGPVTLGADKSLSADAAGTISLPNPISDLATSGAGAIRLAGADVTGLGDIATGAGLTISNTGSGSSLAGTISGGGLTKQGVGTLALGGTNTYTGATTVEGGILRVNGSIVNGSADPDVIVWSTATLGGTGTVAGSVAVQGGGTLAPGTSAGILHTDSLNFGSNSTLAVQIGGASLTPTPQYDQLDVTGSVTFSDPTTLSLSAISSYVPVGGDTFTILNNDSGSPYTGTFAGLPEGAVISGFLGSTRSAQITYQGGDGNDVLLLVNDEPTEIGLTPVSVAENRPVNTVVGMLSTTDPDLPSDGHTYTLVSGTDATDNGSFNIAGSQLLTSAVFDYENKSSYSIRVRTTDAGGRWFEESLTVTVTDVDEIPPTLTGTTPSFAVSGTLDAGTTRLEVAFSEPVVGGDAAGNYRPQSLGPDGLLGTVDDVIVPRSVSYAGTTATLTFDPLPESVYRLTVRDTITDLVGNALDGDADHTAGGNWVREFVVGAVTATLTSRNGFVLELKRKPRGSTQAREARRGASFLNLRLQDARAGRFTSWDSRLVFSPAIRPCWLVPVALLGSATRLPAGRREPCTTPPGDLGTAIPRHPVRRAAAGSPGAPDPAIFARCRRRPGDDGSLP